MQYGNAFFHPKTYHFKRDDGSQCAYVGSANLTEPGVSSLHVEAGLTLDTRDGDPVAVLNDIAAAVDAWFAQKRRGLHVVANAAGVAQLVTDGVLIVAPPPAPPAVATGGSSGGGTAPAGPAPHKLAPLASLPKLPPLTTPTPAPGVVAAPAVAWQARTLLVILVHFDTARIQADRGTDAGKGSQYFLLGKDCSDFFPEMDIPNEEGTKQTWSCEIEAHYMDLELTNPRNRVDYQEGNNQDMRLGTAAYRYTKAARAGDLAALSRIGSDEYELRIIPQTGTHFAALQGSARTPIGHEGKRYGYLDNAAFAAIIGEAVPDPARTNDFNEYRPRGRR